MKLYMFLFIALFDFGKINQSNEKLFTKFKNEIANKQIEINYEEIQEGLNEKIVYTKKPKLKETNFFFLEDIINKKIDKISEGCSKEFKIQVFEQVTSYTGNFISVQLKINFQCKSSPSDSRFDLSFNFFKDSTVLYKISGSPAILNDKEYKENLRSLLDDDCYSNLSDYKQYSEELKFNKNLPIVINPINYVFCYAEIPISLKAENFHFKKYE